MNHYTNLNANIAKQTVRETPFYVVPLLYVLAPISVGSLLDIYINKLIGSQHCSFSDGEQKCSVYGIEMNSWHREILRSIFQLTIAFMIFLFINQYLTNQIYTNLATILFFVSQTYLFDDFRRVLSSVIFNFTYN